MRFEFEVFQPTKWTDATILKGRQVGLQHWWDVVRAHPTTGGTGRMLTGTINEHSQLVWGHVFKVLDANYYSIGLRLKEQGNDHTANLMYLHALCSKLNDKQEET